jgi:hypothetical protein
VKYRATFYSCHMLPWSIKIWTKCDPSKALITRKSREIWLSLYMNYLFLWYYLRINSFLWVALNMSFSYNQHWITATFTLVSSETEMYQQYTCLNRAYQWRAKQSCISAFVQSDQALCCFISVSYFSVYWYWSPLNMINKISKERRCTMNATPTRSSNKKHWQWAQKDPNKNRTGRKAEHGQAYH